MNEPMWSNDRIMERWHELIDKQSTTKYDLLHMRDVAYEMRDEMQAHIDKLEAENKQMREQLKIAQAMEFWDVY